MLQAVGRDNVGHGGDDGRGAEVVKEGLEGGLGADGGPGEASLVVVQANAIRRAKELVKAVVEALLLEGVVGRDAAGTWRA